MTVHLGVLLTDGLPGENEKWFYNGSELETVNEFNYLGMLFNYNGKFNLTQKQLADQGRKAMFALNAKLKNHTFNIETQCSDVAHDVDASFGNVKMTLKSVRYLTTSIAVLRDCRGFAIRKVPCSNPEFYLRYQAQCSLVTHIMYSNFELYH